MLLKRLWLRIPSILQRLSIIFFNTYRIKGPRIIVVGFNKTGTTSLGQCFEILGLGPVSHSKKAPYFSLHKLSASILDDGDYGPALKAAFHFRALHDRPWPIWNMYKIIDLAFPESKFILTYRDPEKWWASVDKWVNVRFKGNKTKLERYLKHLRVDSLEKEKCIAAYLKHNEGIKEYFSNRPEDLLIMNLEENDGWDKLCQFLDKPIPDVPFPHANKQTIG